jgi:hypothetical protein
MKAITLKKASDLKSGELVKLKNMYRNIWKISKNDLTVIITSNSEVEYILNPNEIVKTLEKK